MPKSVLLNMRFIVSPLKVAFECWLLWCGALAVKAGKTEMTTSDASATAIQRMPSSARMFPLPGYDCCARYTLPLFQQSSIRRLRVLDDGNGSAAAHQRHPKLFNELRP